MEKTTSNIIAPQNRLCKRWNDRP